MKRLKHKKLTNQIIKAFSMVYNELGAGFLESVYENAMFLVLTNVFGLDVYKQHPIKVYYMGKKVGDFKADLLVESKIIVELKAIKSLLPEHEAQIINYLKATEIEIGLLMNFGDRPVFKRFIYDK